MLFPEISRSIPVNHRELQGVKFNNIRFDIKPYIWYYGIKVIIMLKKTTIYIEESELNTLKSLSLIQNKSMTELIRLGVQKVCQSVSREEQKALEILTKIRRNTKRQGFSGEKIMTLAIKAQREVRNDRKKKASRRP